MLPTKDKVVMITGANRGIGKTVAEHLYQAGYRLSLGARDLDSLSTTTPSWDQARVLLGRYDAEDYGTHRHWLEGTISKFGRIDGLINNAGMVVRVRVEDHNDEALDRMWRVNVKGPLSMTRLTLPYLRTSGHGRIINIASIAGKAVYNNNAGYAMSKFAFVALSHATRHAGWEDGVRCTALCPSFVRTDMTADVETFPHENMIHPADVAELVLTIMGLSNNASVAELIVNCRNDTIM